LLSTCNHLKWFIFAARKVIQLVVGEERKIAFNTTDAGPGVMEAKVDAIGSESANTVDLCRVESNVAGRCKLVLTPVKPGEYKLDLKWGHHAVEGAPKRIMVHAAPSG